MVRAATIGGSGGAGGGAGGGLRGEPVSLNPKVSGHKYMGTICRYDVNKYS